MNAPSPVRAGLRESERISDPATQLWVELRFTAVPRSFFDLYSAARDRTGMDLHGALRLVDGWVEGGFVERLGQPHVYRATEAGLRRRDPPPMPERISQRPRAIVPGSARARMWTAMRILRRFDLVQLVMAARVARTAARDFVRLMSLAGYLERHGDYWQARAAAAPLPPFPPSITRLGLPGGAMLRVTDRLTGETRMVPACSPKPAPPNQFFGSTSARSGGGEG